MRLRSLLFVPGDRPDRVANAALSVADAVILDLEDSVVAGHKADPRKAVADYLSADRVKPVFIRINPLDSGLAEADMDAVLHTRPDGVMLPKAEGAQDIKRLLALMEDSFVPILPIVTETPRAIFELGSYQAVAHYLAGLTWGAEDLPAAMGAAASRDDDGSYTPPFELARSLTLFAAHAAHVPAIETILPNIRDLDTLASYAARGRRDGFTGMMAIHPVQAETINLAFTPSAEEIAQAQSIIAAFAADPDAGVLNIDGRMLDMPHLKLALRVLANLDDMGPSSSR